MQLLPMKFRNFTMNNINTMLTQQNSKLSRTDTITKFSLYSQEVTLSQIIILLNKANI